MEVILVAEIVADIEKLLDAREEKTKQKRKRAKTADKASKPARKITKKEKQIIEMANNTVLPDHYSTVWTLEDLEDLCGWIKSHDIIAIDTETMGVNPFMDEIVGISFYAPHRGWYIPLKHINDIKNHEFGIVESIETPDGSVKKVVGIDFISCLPKDVVAAALKPLLEDRNRQWILHNAN